MAKITFGSGIAGMRGRMGGAVFSANISGAYTKQYARPVKRHTVWQLGFRARMAAASAQWSYMTDLQRAAWDAYAAAPNEADYDPWGVQYYFSGYYWFVRAAVRRALVDGTWPSTPPSGPAQTPISDLALDIRPYSVGDSFISWTAPVFGSTDILYAELALSDNASNATPKTRYLVIAAYEDPEPSPLEVTLQINFRWGELVPGQKAYLRAWNQNEHGNRSTVAECTAIIDSV